MAKRGVNRGETEALIPEIVPSRDIDQDLEKNATPTKAFARHSGSKIETAFASKPLRTGMLAVSVLVTTRTGACSPSGGRPANWITTRMSCARGKYPAYGESHQHSGIQAWLPSMVALLFPGIQ